MQSKASHARQAYLALEAMVVTRELPPGSVVTERYLVERVALGRTPVREAIQQLSWEGLLEIRPRSGIMVTDLRPEDYLRVMEPRLALEPILARAAARFADAGVRERLRRCAHDMLGHARAGDNLGFLAADKCFDEALQDACPNIFLSRTLAPLQAHARRLWFRYDSADGPGPSAEHHLSVMEAVQAADPERAGQEMLELMKFLTRGAARLVPTDESHGAAR
ncbi:GntR family transcriptional regulator [Aureimonas populi]|uniref:GntR family transcriptional regulator n=1 Tax=Aureimonas populi TaxID=1701758 RepID=A0ABW5CQ16_9HYPH|nr:GntR family transcriptional regulator [Aureimonas populi]